MMNFDLNSVFLSFFGPAHLLPYFYVWKFPFNVAAVTRSKAKQSKAMEAFGHPVVFLLSP